MKEDPLCPELLGVDSDLASVCGFLGELGLGAVPVDVRVALFRSSRSGGALHEPKGDDDSTQPSMALADCKVDLDELAARPDKALRELQREQELADPGSDLDGAARIRVAAARHLWQSEWPDGPDSNSVPLDLRAVLPKSDPDSAIGLIVPCHNDGAFLVDALASVRLCAPEVFHVVVVDDGSTDPITVSILDTLEDEGITVARQEPGGPSRARNLGTQLTAAPTLLNLDSDNLLRPGFASEAFHQLCEQPGTGVVHADAAYFGSRTGRYVSGPYDPVRLLSGNYLDTFSLIRRSALEGVGGWDADIWLNEDWDLWLSLTEAGWGFSSVPAIAFDYRVRANAHGSKLRDPQIRTRLAVTMAEKHHHLYARYLPGVIANFTTALTSLEAAAEAQRVVTGAEAAVRELTDQLNATRSELARQTEVAEQARRRNAANDPSRVAVLRVARSEELTKSTQRQAENAKKEVAAWKSTRTFRWTRLPRAIYGHIRASRERGPRPRA